MSGFGDLDLETEGHRLRAVAEVTFQTPRGPVSGAVDSELFGMGLDVVRHRGLGRSCTLLTVTPIDGEFVDARYTFFVQTDQESGEMTRMGLGFARDFCRQIEQDIPIWENKIYRDRPQLARGEGAINEFPRMGAAFLRGGNCVRSRNYDELFIGGRWQAPSTKRRLSVISPHTEESIGETPEASPEDVDRAVTAARKAFDDGPWPRMSVDGRMEKIEKLTAIYTAETDAMADLITAEMGSPKSFSRLGQGTGAVAQMHLNLATAKNFPWVERRPGLFGDVHVRRAPVGVVGAIVPWNVPQFLIMPKLIPALIAGCTVVVKPAPETPLDALWLAEMLDEIDLPEGVVSIIPGGRETGEALVRHPGVDKISFTGSSATGRHIASLCGEQLKRVSLELGGKSAAIILDDADIDHTVNHLKMASLMNNGQACVAQTRILVSERRHDEVVDALADMMSGLQVGDPADDATDIGPLVAQRQQHRVVGYIEAGVDEGARIVLGGTDKPHDRGWYVQPTLFADATNDDADRARGNIRARADSPQVLGRARRRPDSQLTANTGWAVRCGRRTSPMA